jgi:hypothetical protein
MLDLSIRHHAPQGSDPLPARFIVDLINPPGNDQPPPKTSTSDSLREYIGVLLPAPEPPIHAPNSISEVMSRFSPPSLRVTILSRTSLEPISPAPHSNSSTDLTAAIVSRFRTEFPDGVEIFLDREMNSNLGLDLRLALSPIVRSPMSSIVDEGDRIRVISPSSSKRSVTIDWSMGKRRSITRKNRRGLYAAARSTWPIRSRPAGRRSKPSLYLGWWTVFRRYCGVRRREVGIGSSRICRVGRGETSCL